MLPEEVKSAVDEALDLEQEIKLKKKRLDSIKAELQTEALAYMDNRNLRWKQIFGRNGICNVSYKEKLEVDSLTLLAALCGDLTESKIKKNIEVKYDVDDGFKKALIAIYKNDYRQVDLQQLLSDLGLMSGQIKTVLKKLKGDYVKDKALLESFGVDGDLEEELDAIHDQKNFELVSRYFDPAAIDETFRQKLRLAINVEDGLAVGLVALGGGGSE